ncbi:uncharacterized protein [Hetaerina americana]|uniref:uncharacterized protein n=1 Tax=Hetaerina americana TaxID=62018 RepID=UPI003A7F4E96
MRHEHIAHVLKKRFFRCGKCSYATHVKARYTKHVKYHSMPMIKCERCDFRTPYKWNLDRHCKNHSSDPSANVPGAFRCPICDFSADIKQSLTVHVQNHHLSPEQVQARAARRRNKVGASDSAEAEAAAISAGGTIDSEEMELLRMEREENYYQGGTFGRLSLDSSHPSRLQTSEEPARVSTPSSGGANKLKVTIKKMRGPSATQEQNERHNFRTDFIHPDDIIQKNGNVYIKNLKCSYCSFKAVWEGDILRHESKAHGIDHPKPVPKSASTAGGKKCPRPVPNLIPIQGKGATPVSPTASSSLPILRIPNLKCRPANEESSATVDVEVTMSDKDMNALINAESSRNSALKDFASLIGDLPDDVDKTSRPSTPPKSSAAVESRVEGGEVEGTPEAVASEPSSTSISPPTPSKKTCASFFDRLKERLLVGGGDGLTCEICGHESKCLSEKARHQKLHDSTPEGSHVEESTTPNATPGKKGRMMTGGNALMALSSTRCQHCRQRCKTSADLMVHLQSCLSSLKDEKGEEEEEEDEEGGERKKAVQTTEGEERENLAKLKSEAAAKEAMKQAMKDAMEEGDDGEEGEDPEEGEDGEPHPMENKVFVWNNCAQTGGDSSTSGAQGTQASSASDGEGGGLQSGEDGGGNYAEDGEGLVGVETAPGIGAITGRGGYEGEISPGGRVTLKKVFKCPQCPFWATTASRFHVHAVGHLNRKPFECSACGYRSNWRWDITKHIRLRASWDEAHRNPPDGSDGSGPRVLMTDETGRRNYSKYNRHLTLVRVHEMISSDQGENLPLSSSVSPGIMENGKVTKSMVMLLPAPPRLTPAPVQPTNVVEDGDLTPPLLRPPPPLRAAISTASSAVRRVTSNLNGEYQQVQAEGVVTQGVKRPAPSSEGGATKEGGSTKRTLWKCKKCNYRDASRELILAHVRQHYAAAQQPQPSRPLSLQHQPKASDKSEQKMETEEGTDPMDTSGDEPSFVGRGYDSRPFQCGHCGRISNWKHVIQRHCRLKHGGVISVIEQANYTEEEHLDPSSSWKCEKCPYRTTDLVQLQTHATYHIQRPGANFKCNFCSYYVFEKIHLIGHTRLHTANIPVKPSIPVDNTEQIQESPKGEMKKPEGNEGSKRYSCVGCPYVSDSKSQFLYHKQFHRPRGVAPFKCSFCSYSVSRRHLLHQHLRVHGVSVPANMREDDLRSNAETLKRPTVSRISQPVLDTSRLSDVPLVWVSRAGKFQKMFKCRFCPHVNVRKINIQEHEKMHKQRKASPLNPRQGQSIQGMDSSQNNSPRVGASPHKCPQCNYSCNNAGVLSAHAKVHLDSYGKVYCLVDVNRADEDQIAELEANSMLSSVDQSESDAGGIAIGGASGIVSGNTSSNVGGIPPGIGNGSGGGRVSPEEDLAECAPEVPDVPDSAVESSDGRILHFCPSCPARFVFERELVIHRRFHGIRLPFKCEACSYAARQRPHLLAHLKVHTREYQEKSAALIATHTVSILHPRPHIATTLPNDPLNADSMWIVEPKPPSPPMNLENSMDVSQGTGGVTTPATQPNKHYACDRCPARFFKSVALQYHLTLHGGPGPYRCRTCDYAVKTYGNLVRHEMIHGSTDTPANRNASVSHNPPAVVPLSGTDLFRQREAAGQVDNVPSSPTTPTPSPMTPSTVPPTVDPQFGTLMHGNPDFIYPTYFKNGKLKEKRYKCHKCPSAFEKREQYKVHLSLHGSKQRYRCDKCDYAVKYCANYIQHVRKHTRCEEARMARQQQHESTNGVVQSQSFEAPPMPTPATSAPPSSSSHSSPSRPVKSIAPAIPPALSTAEKQQALLRRLRLEAVGAQEREEEERRKRNVFLCLRCPYNTHRKDSLEAHMRRHPGASELSVAPSPFPCPFCDYAAPQSHFLREHIKLHFRATKTLPRPEAYLSIEKVELWEGENKEDGNVIFKDTGKEGFERFLPPDDGSEMEESGDDSGRTYVDPESGEIIQASEVSSESSVLGQTGEEAVEMKEDDATETKGKDLGGDWTIGDILDEDDSSRDGDDMEENKAMECTSVI